MSTEALSWKDFLRADLKSQSSYILKEGVMLKDFKPRLYQETIFNTASKSNTLVVLPTGMGKTAIALMLAAHRLTQYPNSKILILAPTKPLVEQHKQTFEKYLDIDPAKLAVFTGFVSPEKRAKLWNEAQIFFSTPQGLENDVIASKIKLEEVSLLVIDEAHRAVGDYAYNFVAKQYDKLAKYPRILALTASPGSDVEKITEVCKNLSIEAVEIRTTSDPDVKPYVQDVKTQYVEVNLPAEFMQVKKYLDDCYRSKLSEIKNLGYLNSVQNVSKKELLMLQAQLHAKVAQGEKDLEILRSISLAAEAMKVSHALELLETQSPKALLAYLERLQRESSSTKVKAVQNLVKDINFKSAAIKTRTLVDKNIEHPKFVELMKYVSAMYFQEPETKMIIFNNYRENAQRLVDEIKRILGARPVLFVGQAKKEGSGLSQKEQKKIIEDFKNNVYNVLVCTSIGEEGLDIPKVDEVIFYEPIPSAIRHIQRKGRTGRLEKGAVKIFMTKNSRDEFYRWSAHHKEKRMHRILAELKTKFVKSDREIQSKFIADKDLAIAVDHREKSSGVIKELIDMGIKIELKQLNVGDYIISDRVAVEYKTVQDFVDSIIDGRLLEQIKGLREGYFKPLIIIEGDEDIFSQRNIHPNAIRGMLATITVSYGIPVIQTKNFKETANLLAVIAKRESEEGRNFSFHNRKPTTLKDQQEYIVSSLPNIGPSLAKDLLQFFGTPRAIFNASEQDLKKVEGIGEKLAKNIKEVSEKEYKQ